MLIALAGVFYYPGQVEYAGCLVLRWLPLAIIIICRMGTIDRSFYPDGIAEPGKAVMEYFIALTL